MPVRFGIAISQDHVADIRKQAEAFAAEITDTATGTVNGHLMERERWNELVHHLHISCFRAAVDALKAVDPALGVWQHPHSEAFEDKRGMLNFTLEMTAGISELPTPQEVLGLPKPPPARPQDFVDVVMKAVERDYEPAAEAIFTEIKYAELFSPEDAAALRKKAEESAQKLLEGIAEIDSKYSDFDAEEDEDFLSPEERAMHRLEMVDTMYLLLRKVALMEKIPSPSVPEPVAEVAVEKPKPKRHLHVVRR